MSGANKLASSSTMLDSIPFPMVNSWRFRILIPALTIGFLVSGRAAPGPSLATHAPNIILITLDTTRADRMGFLGSERDLTPNLDALAKESVVFRRAYAQVPLTTPSHAVLLTGTYPQFNHIEELGTALSKDLPYLPDLLRSRGYRTAAFVGSYILDPAGMASGFERGFDFYDAHFHERQPGEDRYRSVERRARDVLSHAMTWLNSQTHGPFFLWLHFYDPHDPYDPPEPFKTRYASQPYDGEIAYTDRVIGELIGALRNRGLYKNAVIAVAADHGEAFGEHGEERHGMFLYDETIHVPLLLKLPEQRFAGRNVERRVSLVDVAPTLLEAAGFSVPPEVQGQSLLPLFDGPTKNNDDKKAMEAAVYSQSNYARGFGWSGLSSWRTGKYLYVKAPRRELYDQSSDREARRNLAPAARAVADTLDQQLTSFQKKTETGKPALARLDPAQADKLRALGYMPSDNAVTNDKENALIDPKDKIEVANRFHRAAVDFEEDRYDKGIANLRELIRLEPGMAGASMELGRALCHEQRYEEALPIYRDAVKRMPESAAAHYELGLTLVKAKQWEAALPEAQAAVGLTSDSAQLHYFLGIVQLHLKHISDATAELETSLKIDPNHFAANLKYGEMLLLEGNAGEALPRLKHAAELDPESAEAHQYLAETYHQLGRTQEESSERAKAASLKVRPPE